jgi:hypothetical protein
MTDPERITERARHLLPEEQRVGSDDPEAQADAVLTESDERERYVESTPDLRIEHRTAEEAASG